MSEESTSRRGAVVVISGPSGVGKSTVCHQLCGLVPAEFSVSVTTRKPRPGEQNARDYHYVGQAEFDRLRDGGGLVEWAEVYGNWYGTPLAPIESALVGGRVMILEIDIQGCLQVRKKLPEVMAFFLLPPTFDEQRRRIEGRHTDDAEVIRRRLEQADGEIRFANEAGCYDEFIINDNLEETVKTIHRRIAARLESASKQKGS